MSASLPLPLARWLLAAAVAVLAGCASFPPPAGRTESSAYQDTAGTRLGRVIAGMVAAHPGETGVFPLTQGLDAFAARARLADAAERSLDVQYYIWHDDMSGNLLLDALRRAADRGVRVRLLLDDNNTLGMDPLLAELTARPNIEVRLFNPNAQRRWRALGQVADFARQNRRMHNKSFTADNQVTIVGGRNVGDEYFAAGQNLQFVDLDVMAIGDVVTQVSRDFDRYWASDSAYPAAQVVQPQSAPATPLTPQASAGRAAMAGLYLDALERQGFVREMMELRLPIDWGQVRMVSDDPAKGLGRASEEGLLWSRLMQVVKTPRRTLELVSPYFVPGDKGTDQFIELARQGVQVSVLTNSLAATDVSAVHSGYARRRMALLQAGVNLYEMKRDPLALEPRERLGSSSSASSLHAKTFSVDRSALFVGSFNFDPRSARLNTELGFLIENPRLAAMASEVILYRLARNAYRVQIGPEGTLQWVDKIEGREVVFDQEPGAGFWRQLGVSLLSLLPIEWLL